MTFLDEVLAALDPTVPVFTKREVAMALRVLAVLTDEQLDRFSLEGEPDTLRDLALRCRILFVPEDEYRDGFRYTRTTQATDFRIDLCP